MDLQDQINNNKRELQIVQSKLNSLQKDQRVNQVTTNQLKLLEKNTKLYKSIGKSFVLSNEEEINKKLVEEIEYVTKTSKILVDQQEYLERKITSDNENLKDLLYGV
jgi:prefoldin subunit 1